MTVFGFVWIIVLLYCGLQRDIRYFVAITLLAMTLQCVNVIDVSGLKAGPQIITSAACILKVLVHVRGKLIFSRKKGCIIVCLLTLLALTVYSSVQNGIFQAKLLVITQLAVYGICFVCLCAVQKEVPADFIYHLIRTIVVFLLTVGVLQLLSTTGILPIRSVLRVLLFNDPSSNVMFNRSYYNRITSTFMEPSYFAGILVGAFYYFLGLKKEWSKNILLMAAVLVELFLTRSSTAYIAFCVAGLVFLICFDQIGIKSKIALSLCALVALAFLLIAFYDLFDSVIFSKASTGSYLTRAGWDRRAIRMFESSPWYGVGYKNCRGSSIITSLLGQLGIIGFVLYSAFNFMLCRPMAKTLNKSSEAGELYISTGFAILAVLICQMIACPDLDLCSYWFWIYCAAVTKQEAETEPQPALTYKRHDAIGF